MSGNRVYVADPSDKAVEEVGKESWSYAKVLKVILSVALVLVAVVFGGIVTRMNFASAFATVFVYISVQLGLWM